MQFDDRKHAGKALAAVLADLGKAGKVNLQNAIVLALPRGGVPVGFAIAKQLHLPLDVCVVRKVGVPSQPELALAAVAEGGELVVNKDVQAALGLTMAAIQELAAPKHLEVAERINKFRGGRTDISVKGKTAILVDDGLATGATALAAIHVLKKTGAAAIVLALPVCPDSAVARFRGEVDELVVLHAPVHFYAVGNWYRDFAQVSDDEVGAILSEASRLQNRYILKK
jgi:predicted phosphoribosyltransferase